MVSHRLRVRKGRTLNLAHSNDPTLQTKIIEPRVDRNRHKVHSSSCRMGPVESQKSWPDSRCQGCVCFQEVLLAPRQPPGAL